MYVTTLGTFLLTRNKQAYMIRNLTLPWKMCFFTLTLLQNEHLHLAKKPTCFTTVNNFTNTDELITSSERS
jgi:hypothetical protein